MSAPLVQYVVVRGDLLKALKWPVGAVIAQACHACSAAIHLYQDDASTIEYLKNLDSMHKIILEVRTRLGKSHIRSKCLIVLLVNLIPSTSLPNTKCNKKVLLWETARGVSPAA